MNLTDMPLNQPKSLQKKARAQQPRHKAHFQAQNERSARVPETGGGFSCGIAKDVRSKRLHGHPPIECTLNTPALAGGNSPPPPVRDSTLPLPNQHGQSGNPAGNINGPIKANKNVCLIHNDEINTQRDIRQHVSLDDNITKCADNLHMSTFSERLRFARKKRELTQPELAKKCGWESQSRISMYERDEREPSIKTVQHLAKALNASLTWLLTSDGNWTNTPHDNNPETDLDNLSISELTPDYISEIEHLTAIFSRLNTTNRKQLIAVGEGFVATQKHPTETPKKHANGWPPG